MRKRPLDLQQLNPNWKLAEDHGRANKPGLFPKDERFDSILLCPCCLNLINKEPVRICQNSKELSFLGYGFPLFYNLLQFCIASMVILILTETILLLYLALRQECQHVQIGGHRLLAASSYKRCAPFIRVARLDPKFTNIDIILRILAFAGQLFLMLYFRDSQTKLAGYHVERNLKIKDFSIIFKNLPGLLGIQKRIRDFLTIECKQCKPQIMDIMLIPRMDEYYEKQKQKETIINKKKKILENPDNPHFDSLISHIDQTIDQINDSMTTVCKRIHQMASNDTLYASKAIVILNTEQQKIDVLNAFRTMEKSRLQNYFVWMADQLNVKQAPDPKEIIWENLNYPKNQRWLKVLIGWLLSFLVLGAITGVVYALIRAKGRKLDLDLHGEQGYTKQDYVQAQAIVFITIISVQLFNKFVMKAILHKICDFQMPQTTSQLEFSYAFKYTLGMFFTTAVMTLTVEALEFENYAGEYGVVEEETIIFFFNAFFVNFLWLTHPQYYIRKLMRRLKKGKTNLTQKEANTLMEDYPYDMGKRYAEVLETMWFTFLYSSLIPLGSIISLFGFIIYYWMDRYNLLRRSTVSTTIQSKLPINATKLMELTLIFKPIGQIIFDRQLRGKIHPSSYIMLAIGVIYLLLPWPKILHFLFEQKFNVKTKTYEESQHLFTDVYKTVDPIHRHLALQNFLSGKNKNQKYKTLLGVYDDKNNNTEDQFVSQMVINMKNIYNENAHEKKEGM